MAVKFIATVTLDGTNRSLQQLYRAYNKAYYGNTLDSEIKVRFSRLQEPMRDHAHWVPEDEEIVLDKKYRRSGRLTCWFLLHEMSHISTGWRGNKHGRVFDNEQFRIASIGAFRRIW
jgi:hypothetical protein